MAEKIEISKTKGEKKLIEMRVIRKNFITFWVKACPEWEEFLETMSDKNSSLEKQRSLKGFTNVKDTREMDFYVQPVNEKDWIDSFDYPVVENGRINFAILRFKGVSSEQGITIKTRYLMSKHQLEQHLRALGNEFKRYYIQYVKRVDANVTVAIE